MSPAEFTAFVAGEIDKWAPVAKQVMTELESAIADSTRCAGLGRRPAAAHVFPGRASTPGAAPIRRDRQDRRAGDARRAHRHDRPARRRQAHGLAWDTVVDRNKPGASNNLGTDIVAKSRPTATRWHRRRSHATNKYLFKQLPFDPVTTSSRSSSRTSCRCCCAVHPTVPAKNVPELVAWIKANPAKARSPRAAGSSQQMAAEMFKSMAGITHAARALHGSSAAIPT